MNEIVKKESEIKKIDKETEVILRTTVAKGLTDAEFSAFWLMAQKKKLDPFLRQIYAVKRAGQMTIQAGIDGLRAIAVRSGLSAGSDIEYIEKDGKLFAAKVTVYRLANKGASERYGYTAFAHLDEFKPQINDFMWKKMPHVMLAKCAESAALRKAFPEDLAGLYSTEEMQQANN